MVNGFALTTRDGTLALNRSRFSTPGVTTLGVEWLSVVPSALIIDWADNILTESSRENTIGYFIFLFFVFNYLSGMKALNFTPGNVNHLFRKEKLILKMIF